MNVQAFLRDKDTDFEVLDHWPTYNAQTLAQAVHVPGQEVAKTVLLSVDGEYVLAVLPATHCIDTTRVQGILKANAVELASEDECGDQFDDCELGALPPFGSQYGLGTLVDQSLLDDEEIVFEGNTHEEAIRMKLADYRQIENPVVGVFAYHV